MYFIDSKHPPGTVGAITHELSRYSDFSISMVSLFLPEGSGVIWHKGVEIAAGLNTIVRNMVGEWVFILGDDHAFDPDVVMRLLDTGKDIVVPLCSGRVHPFRPVLYKDHIDNTFTALKWDEIPLNQLFKVAAAGSAGMLIRKHVFDAIGDPWFEAGQTSKENIGEDMWFCKKARKAGFEVWADSRLSIGHITPSTIWPKRFEDAVIPMANFNGKGNFWVRMDTGFKQPDPEVEAPNIEGIIND